MLSRTLSVLLIACFVQALNAAPAVIKTQPLGNVLIEKKYTAPATTLAINTSQISAEISARITHIEVRVGDVVEAGKVLAQLDCRSYQNALNSANAQRESLAAQVALAAQQVNRAKTLRAENNLSAAALDQRLVDMDIATANLQSQKAAVSDARLAIERCTVTTPFRAAVTARLAGVGTMATPGLPLLEIVGLDTVELSAQVPVSLTDSLRQSRTLDFVANSKTQAAIIRNLSPVINAAAGNREVRLTTTETLPPGTSGRLEWYSPPLLPANLLSRRNGTLGVFVVALDSEPARAKFVALENTLEGRPAPIDLPIDTTIITGGRHKLTDGDAVSIAAE